MVYMYCYRAPSVFNIDPQNFSEQLVYGDLHPTDNALSPTECKLLEFVLQSEAIFQIIHENG